MAKTLDLGVPKGDKKAEQKKESSNTLKKESGAKVDLNFKVSAEFKKEFKLWAVSHEMTQKQVLETAFQLLKESRI